MELAFRLAGKLAPRDHGYALFGAICRILGDLHGVRWLSVLPLSGTPVPGNQLALDAHRGLRVRVEPGEIPRVLPLAGKRLELDGHALQVGVSAIYPLQPASELRARLVTIKGFMEPEPFREAVLRQLSAMEVAARVEVGRRRVISVNGDTVVGFGVTLHEVEEDASLRVQYAGVGGKQRMGCGIFEAMRRSGSRTKP